MALPTEANYKIEVAKIATALNVMWDGPEVSNPMVPLRQLMRQLIMGDDGTVTANDDYVTAAYAGLSLNNAESVDSKVFTTQLVLVSATVEALAPADIVLTFGTDINQAQNLGVGGVVTTPKIIDTVDITAAVVTITVDSDYIATDTITASGTFIAVDGSIMTLIDQVVTNNVV